MVTDQWQRQSSWSGRRLVTSCPPPPGQGEGCAGPGGCGTWWLCSDHEAPGIGQYQQTNILLEPGLCPPPTPVLWPVAGLVPSRESLGLSAWMGRLGLLVCRSLSMGQGAFKANLQPDIVSRHKVESIFWDQRWLISSTCEARCWEIQLGGGQDQEAH